MLLKTDNEIIKKQLNSLIKKEEKKVQKKNFRDEIKKPVKDIISNDDKDLVIKQILDNDDGKITSYTKLYNKIKESNGKMIISRNQCKVAFSNYKKEQLYNAPLIPNNFNAHVEKSIKSNLGNFKEEFKSEFSEMLNQFKNDFKIKEKKVEEPIKKPIEKEIRENIRTEPPLRMKQNIRPTFQLGRLPSRN